VGDGGPLGAPLRPEPVARGTIQRQEAGEKSSEEPDWKKPSEDVAKTAKDAFTIAGKAARKFADFKRGARNDEDARKLEEFAERMDKGVELIEEGTKGFEKIADAVDLFTEVSGAYEQFMQADPAKNPAQAAHAFDHAFTVLGKLGQRLPGGQWQAYFKLLSKFGDGRGFFYGTEHGLIPSWREQERAMLAGQRGSAQEVQQLWEGTPPVPVTPAPSGPVQPERAAESAERKPEAPVSLDTLKGDVEKKYQSGIKEVTGLGLFESVSNAQKAKKQFDSAYGQLIAAKKNYDGLAILGLHIFKHEASQRASAVLGRAAEDVHQALIALEQALVEENFQPDIDEIYKLTQAHSPRPL
jgi:hypothetical protein